MFCLAKNRKALLTTVCLAAAYIALVVMFVSYEDNTANTLSLRFNNCVRRSLIETARKIEERDMIKIIGDIACGTTEQAQSARTILADDETISNFFSDIHTDTPSDSLSIKRSDEMRKLMFEVLARKYENAFTRSIQERIDPQFLRQTLTTELHSSGINEGFSFIVICRHSGIVERFGEKPFNFNDSDNPNIFEQTLFSREINDRPLTLIVKVNGRSDFVHCYSSMVLPIVICMTILLIILIYTIIHVVRSERLAEIQKAFVKNMTHELKTPVASISLASEMLADPSLNFSPETYASKCHIINNEAKRLANIIEHVLQASVLEQKHFTYSTDTVNINDIISSARDSFILKVQQTSPDGKIVLHPNAERHVIYADRMHITNVVYNLMDNALKYRDVTRPLILEIATRNEDDRILIDFTDNGIGIKNEHLKNIFDKFYRIPTGDRHDVKGFGLGLSYVHHVVTHNGGKISVQSKPGVGTCFTLDFPAFKS